MNKVTYFKPKDCCEPNVKVLQSGYYGYILEDKAIFKTYSYKTINKFAKWANTETDLGIIVEKAVEWQQKEDSKLLPEIFDDGKIYIKPNFYESVLRQKI